MHQIMGMMRRKVFINIYRPLESFACLNLTTGTSNSSSFSLDKTHFGAWLSHRATLPSLRLKSGCLGFTYKIKINIKILPNKLVREENTKSDESSITTNPLSLLSRKSDHCFGSSRRSVQELSQESGSFFTSAVKQIRMENFGMFK